MAAVAAREWEAASDAPIKLGENCLRRRLTALVSDFRLFYVSTFVRCDISSHQLEAAAAGAPSGVHVLVHYDCAWFSRGHFTISRIQSRTRPSPPSGLVFTPVSVSSPPGAAALLHPAHRQ